VGKKKTPAGCQRYEELAAGTGGLGGFAFLVGKEIGVGAFEIVDVTVVEVPDARGNFVEKIVVVGDEENSALVFLQRDVKRVDGFEIEVIARLVEDENVGLEEHEAAEKDTSSFAAGESLDGLCGVVAAEKHLTEKAAKGLLAGERIELCEPFDDCGARSLVEIVFLREIADAGFVAPADGAAVDAEVAIGFVDETRRVANE